MKDHIKDVEAYLGLSGRVGNLNREEGSLRANNVWIHQHLEQHLASTQVKIGTGLSYTSWEIFKADSSMKISVHSEGP